MSIYRIHHTEGYCIVNISDVTANISDRAFRLHAYLLACGADRGPLILGKRQIANALDWSVTKVKDAAFELEISNIIRRIPRFSNNEDGRQIENEWILI